MFRRFIDYVSIYLFVCKDRTHKIEFIINALFTGFVIYWYILLPFVNKILMTE